jgi:hypothetical protein
MIETAADNGGNLRALLRVGGVSVARQQLALAAALGCDRVVCVARDSSPDLGELQGAAEKGGARFHQIVNARGLAGLITAADDVMVFADGLFASTAEAAALLEPGNVVLVQPIDRGLAGGFERIDTLHAAGGAMRIPGRLVERLAELPADCDVVSALLRIALQAGIAQRPIPDPGASGRFWTLVRSDADAHALEPQWIRQRTREAGPRNLTRVLSLTGVRAFGPALLHGGAGPGTLGVAAGAVKLMGLGAGWFGHGVLALLFLALAALVQDIWALVARIEDDDREIAAAGWKVGVFGWALDAVMIFVMVWNAAGPPAASAPLPMLVRLFPPVMLVGLLRVVSRTLSTRWAVLLRDRLILALVLAIAVAAGSLNSLVYIAGILLLIVGIAWPAADSRLTRP